MAKNNLKKANLIEILNDDGSVSFVAPTGYIKDLSIAKQKAERLTKERGEKFNVYKQVLFGYYVVIKEKEFNKKIQTEEGEKFEHPLLQTIYTKVVDEKC